MTFCEFCVLLIAGHSSLGNLPSLSYGSVYMKLWHGLCNLDNDPHPVVGSMSHKVTNHVRNKVISKVPLKEFGCTIILNFY